MPASLIPIIAAIASAGVGIGSTIYSDLNQPSTPKLTPAAPAGPTPQQVQAAVAPQALSIESATGGSVSPDYLSTIAPVLGGVAGSQPGSVQSVINQILGNGSANQAPGGLSTAPFTPSGLPTNVSALAATPGTSTYLQNLAGQL